MLLDCRTYTYTSAEAVAQAEAEQKRIEAERALAMAKAMTEAQAKIEAEAALRVDKMQRKLEVFSYCYDLLWRFAFSTKMPVFKGCPKSKRTRRTSCD